MSSVKLREKSLKDNRLSLYLDFYPGIPHPGTGKITRREFLKIHIYQRPKTSEERKHNKEMRKIAEQIRDERAIQIAKGNFDFLATNRGNESFLNFFKEKVDYREKINTNSATWRSVYLHLFRYTEGHLLVKNVNKVFCEKFKQYLLHEATTLRSKRNIAHNTAASYFDVFKEAIYQAYDEGLLKDNPILNVKSISQQSTKREFLSWEELKAAIKEECPDPVLKQAAIFSALTGLRFAFVQSLCWEHLQHSEKNGYFLRKQVEKSNTNEVIFISDQARELMGEEQAPELHVFQELSYSNKTTTHLKEWLGKAGINRHITFHAFRHTFATLQLTFGTDIYTVSKLLHHKNVQTTQIYARVLDEKKKEAVNRLPKL